MLLHVTGIKTITIVHRITVQLLANPTPLYTSIITAIQVKIASIQSHRTKEDKAPEHRQIGLSAGLHQPYAYAHCP